MADQLRAVSWKNRLSGRMLSLGDGPEVEFDIGLPGQALVTPKLTVKKGPTRAIEDCREAAFDLVATDPAVTARVTYVGTITSRCCTNGLRSATQASRSGTAC